MTRVEPKLPDVDANLEAVERALTKLPQSESFVPAEHRGIQELFAEAERNHAAQGELLKMIKARLEHFNRLQSDFYNGRS